MHFLGFGRNAYPSSLGFGSARIWDMGVRWTDLQPSSTAWSQPTLARLDSIVDTFHRHGVSPLLVLGVTPAWAARTCNNGGNPVGTCGPRATGTTSAWGRYVSFLATRYDGQHGHPKVAYFETWNEANLGVGWNDTVGELAALQQSAYTILHGHGHGQKLLSASYALSYGSGPSSLGWLESFLAQPGGTAYDITDLHMYPMVPTAEANYGPEWAIQQLAQVREVLQARGVGARPTWNTEANVGARYSGADGAAQVVRTIVLGAENNVARTFWYAADDRAWGGVWLENSDYRTLAAPGLAYQWATRELTGARAYGCAIDKHGASEWNYTCRFRLVDGRSMLVLWTTGASLWVHGPKGTESWYSVTGGMHKANEDTALAISHVPIYLVGTFSI